MCLAIPGKIVEIVDEDNHIAKVEVGGVKRTEAATACDQLARTATVAPNIRDDVRQDPSLVVRVASRAFLDRNARVGPGLVIERVHAVELHAAAGEQLSDRRNHPPTLELAGITALGGERQDGATPVPVRRYSVHRPASRPVRCGSKASRQAV